MLQDPPFTMLNEAAIAAAELKHDPFDYCYMDQAIDQSHKREVLADAPTIPYRGSYALGSLRYGPSSTRACRIF